LHRPAFDITIGHMASRPLVRIFISYRRADSLDSAAHLQATLTRRFGAGAVFRDQTHLRPGQDFPKELEQAIRRSTSVIAVIGRKWAGPADSTGRTRLHQQGDLVRRELEIALASGKSVIPVLVDGAEMPTAADLPKSLLPLRRLNAVELPWHQATGLIAEHVAAVARDMESEVRVPVDTTTSTAGPASRHAALMAMQASLKNQGLKKVELDARDFEATLGRLSDIERDVYVFPDLIYALDLIGVKAKRSDQRYVARSKALASLDDVVTHLLRNQTVLAGVNRTMAWFRDARFGRSGVLTLSWDAARQLIDLNELRAIDTTPLPLPVSRKAMRDFESRLPRKRRPKKETT
jgi:hypothetical protein